MGNFSVLPLKQVGGARKVRFVNVDFDDAGRGPFVLDIVRYLIASKSIRRQIKNRPLERSYLAGLAGKKLDPPKKVRALLAMPVSKYDAKAAAYAKKNSSKYGFVFRRERSSRTRQRSPARQSKACSRMRKSSIWQSGTKSVAEASMQLRIWVLVEDRKSRRIVELKQYGKPAIANYRAQPPAGEWLNEVRRTFWPGLDGSAYDLVDLPGAGLFWIRKSTCRSSTCLIQAIKRRKSPSWMLWRVTMPMCWVWHTGVKPKPLPTAPLSKKTRKHFHDAIEPVARAYLELARENFRDK